MTQSDDNLSTRLKIIVRAQTKPGSRHQAEALKMVDSHLSRFNAEIKTIKCDNCGASLECVRWTDMKDGSLVDTWGYLETDRNSCHHCCDDGYIGDIFLPKQPR